MRPNTIVLGFYDGAVPQDRLARHPAFEGSEETALLSFPPVRGATAPRRLSPQEYVAVVADAVKMLRNVMLARSFEHFDKARAPAIDVWPLNLLRPDSARYADTCSLFLLQMACVLSMARSWRRAQLRLFLCVETGARTRGQEDKLRQLLKELRIQAAIRMVPWDAVVALHWQKQQEQRARPVEAAMNFPGNATCISDEYLKAANRLILEQSPSPTIRFLYLPRPPADTSLYPSYLHQLELLTRDLGPTLLVHGVSAVTSTEL